jgi:hypothetical protein
MQLNHLLKGWVFHMGNEISTESRMLNTELIVKLALSAFINQPIKIQQQLLKSKSEQTFSGLLVNQMMQFQPLGLGDSSDPYSGHLLLEFKGVDYKKRTSKGVKHSRNFHDISIVNQDGIIETIIENKFWYHFDGSKGKKNPRPEKGIYEQLEGDIFKIRQTFAEKSGPRKGFLLLNVVTPGRPGEIPPSYRKDHSVLFERAQENFAEYRAIGLAGYSTILEKFESEFADIFSIGSERMVDGSFVDFFCVQLSN